MTAFCFILHFLLFAWWGAIPGDGVTTGMLQHPPDTSPSPHIYVIPAANGTDVQVFAGHLSQVTTPITARLYGGTSHEPGHSGYDPNTGEYDFGFVSVCQPTQDSDTMRVDISTTASGKDSILLGASYFRRYYVPGTARRVLASHDTRARLTVMPEALPSNTYMVMLDTAAPPGEPPAGHTPLGSTYAIRPSGVISQSQAPLLLDLDYQSAPPGIDLHTLGLFAWNPNLTQWYALDSHVVSPTVQASIRRFETYSVFIGPTWRDTFWDGTGLDLLDNVTREIQGRLRLADTATSGRALSIPIARAENSGRWKTVHFSGTTPPGTTLAVDVLAEDGSILLEDLVDGASLATIDPAVHPRLRLALRLASQQVGLTPRLDAWSISRTTSSVAPRQFLPVLVRGGASFSPPSSAAPDSLADLVSKSTATLALPSLGARTPLTASWTAAGLVGKNIDALAVDPTSAAVVYAAVGSSMPWGVFKTTNGGQTWAEVYDGLPNFGLAIDPQRPATVFSSAGGTIIKTNDGGNTWRELSLSPPDPITFAIDPNQTNTVFAGSGYMWGLYKSTDGGANWGSRVWFGNVFTVAVDPRNSAVVLIGTEGDVQSGGVVKSTDGGLHWTQVRADPQVNVVVVDPFNSQVIYAGTEGRGILKSGDGGLHWAIANTGLSNLLVRAIAPHPRYRNVLFAGTWEDGVFRSIDGGASWHSIGSGLQYPYILSLAIDPGTGKTLYAGTQAGGVYKLALEPPPPPPGSTYAHVIDENNVPVEGAQVYRNGALLQDGTGQSLTTDAAGNLILPDSIRLGDHLVAFLPLYQQPTVRQGHDGWAYRVVKTSLISGTDGSVSGHTVSAPGQQMLRLASPLALFNLAVSVEWNATPDYLQDMVLALQRASDYLFDATDGQMAFGQVAIYDNGREWSNADIQVLTRNEVVPIGDYDGLLSPNLSLVIRLGRHWDRARGQGRWSAQDGYRTIIHEFGHYAFGLYDSYEQYVYDDDGNILGSNEDTGCTTKEVADTDPSMHATLMDTQYAATEFSDRQLVPDLWTAQCELTVQWQTHHLSDWEMILARFGDLSQPPRWRFLRPADRARVLAGPDVLPASLLPFPVMHFTDSGEDAPPRLLLVQQMDGSPYTLGALVALDTVRAGTIMILDQGRTDAQGQILIYGASTGNEVRVGSVDGALYSNVTISTSLVYTVVLPTGSQNRQDTVNPYVFAVPYTNMRDLLVSSGGVGPGGILSAFVVSPVAQPGQTIDLVYDQPSQTYQGIASFGVSGPGLGRAHVRGMGAAGPSQHVTADANFALTAVETNQSQDLYSPDGNAWLHLEAGSFTAAPVSMILMSTGNVPHPLPGGMRVIGDAYSVRASGVQMSLAKPAVLRLFYDPAHLDEVNSDLLQVARWQWGVGWVLMPSQRDPEHFAISTLTQQLGIYALLVPANTTPLTRRAYVPLWHRQRQ